MVLSSLFQRPEVKEILRKIALKGVNCKWNELNAKDKDLDPFHLHVPYFGGIRLWPSLGEKPSSIIEIIH